MRTPAAAANSGPGDAATEGLRARKKRLTREAIVKTAADLFAARGYDAVTVEQVARYADVSEQTVYNYFPTKEHLVFDRAEEFDTVFQGAVFDRPPGVALMTGVRETTAQFLDQASHGRDGGLVYLLARSPQLQRSWLTLTDGYAESLTAALIEESGGRLAGPTARVIASSMVSVFATIVRELGRPDREGDVAALRQAVDEALHFIEQGLAGFGL